MLQVPGALPAFSHASLGSGRGSRPQIFLSTSQSIDRYSPHRLSPADSVEGFRFTSAPRGNRHRLDSAHSIDGYRFSPARRISRHRLSSTRSVDGYRLNAEPGAERPRLRSSHSIDRHSSLRLSPTYSASRQPSQWLSPDDGLDRNMLSPSYVPDTSGLKRPPSFRSASRQLRRQVSSSFFFLLFFFKPSFSILHTVRFFCSITIIYILLLTRYLCIKIQPKFQPAPRLHYYLMIMKLLKK